DPGPVAPGSIQATLSSSVALRMSLTATDENTGFTSEEIFADENGNVLISDLPEGSYTVTARAYIPADSPTTPVDVSEVKIVINGVVVVADQITNLGIISFD